MSHGPVRCMSVIHLCSSMLRCVSILFYHTFRDLSCTAVTGRNVHSHVLSIVLGS